MSVTVEVEYCGMCSYEPHFKELEQQVLQALPDASVKGTVGRKASFEVTINNVEVFSKLKVGKFPNMQEVVEIAKGAKNGEEITTTTVTGTEGMCIIS